MFVIVCQCGGVRTDAPLCVRVSNTRRQLQGRKGAYALTEIETEKRACQKRREELYTLCQIRQLELRCGVHLQDARGEPQHREGVRAHGNVLDGLGLLELAKVEIVQEAQVVAGKGAPEQCVRGRFLFVGSWWG